MKNKELNFSAPGFFLSFFFFATMPVWAQSVDKRIHALEQELSRLKREQMELKKESVAAAAALPTFTYRPGTGMTIEAGDRSWSLNSWYMVHYFMYSATKGSATRGSTVLDLFLRRNRLTFQFCLNNCFYDYGIAFRLTTGLQVSEQNQWLNVHFEQMNPMFPSLTIGDTTNPVLFPYVGRSNSSSSQIELASDMLNDSDADELPRKAIALYWANRPIPWAMLPGDFTLDLEFKSGANIFRNVVADTNRKQFQGTFGLRPFVTSKNPWLEKIKWGIGLQIDSVDGRSTGQGKRLRIMTMERGTNRVTLLDANFIGSGLHHRIETGLEWGYGPYLTRIEGGVSHFSSGKTATPTTSSSVCPGASPSNPLSCSRSDGFKGVRGGYWRIGHEIFLWSPKGLLTGSASTPRSVQLGWAFERSQADCGSHAAGCAGGTVATGNNDFHRNHLINRDLELWYFVARNIRAGVWWWWYRASNTPRATQVQIGCTKNVNAVTSKECSWHTVSLGLQASF